LTVVVELGTNPTIIVVGSKPMAHICETVIGPRLFICFDSFPQNPSNCEAFVKTKSAVFIAFLALGGLIWLFLAWVWSSYP
jgi:hypothetical protein